jgi:flagellar biosynthesis/type III secretory pathway protein FliH
MKLDSDFGYKIPRTEQRQIDELKEEISLLNQKIDFMVKRTSKQVKEEVTERLNEEGFRQYLTEFVVSYLKAHIAELFAQVSMQTIAKINNNIKNELKLTRDLCYSIDMDIKHTLRELPISHHTEKIISDRIELTIRDMIGKGTKQIGFELDSSSQSEKGQRV